MAGDVNISYRPVRAIGLLLVLQLIGLAGLGAYEFFRLIGGRSIPDRRRGR